jgi:hypothetical protein
MKQNTLIPFPTKRTRIQTQSLYRYLVEHGFLVHAANRKRKRNEPDHARRIRMTSLGSGSVSCPLNTLYNDIYKLLAQDISAGHAVCWNVMAHEDDNGIVFCLELDYDVPKDSNLQHKVQNILVHVRQMQEIVQQYWPIEKTQCVVLSAVPRMKSKSGSTLIHLGVHVIFPELITTVEQAKQMIHHMKIHFVNTKELDVDSPYTTHGARLRPYGCHKAQSCQDCEGDEEVRSECKSCNGTGKQIRLNAYGLDFIMHPDGQREKPQLDTLQILRLTSIVPEPGKGLTSGYHKPGNAPTPIPDTYVHRKDPTRFKGERKIDGGEVFDENKIQIVTEEIRKLNRQQYGNCIIRLMRKSSTYIAPILHGGQSWCLLQQKNHEHNHVYFTISKSGFLYFNCHDDKCKKRLKDPSIRKKLSVRIPSFVLTTLFPERAKDFHNFNVRDTVQMIHRQESKEA